MSPDPPDLSINQRLQAGTLPVLASLIRSNVLLLWPPAGPFGAFLTLVDISGVFIALRRLGRHWFDMNWR